MSPPSVLPSSHSLNVIVFYWHHALATWNASFIVHRWLSSDCWLQGTGAELLLFATGAHSRHSPFAGGFAWFYSPGVCKVLLCSEYVVIFPTTVKQMVLYPEDLKPRRNGLAQHHGTSKWKGQVPTPGHLSLAWVFRDCLELFVEGSLSVCWSWKVSDFRARWDTLRISTKGFALWETFARLHSGSNTKSNCCRH